VARFEFLSVTGRKLVDYSHKTAVIFDMDGVIIDSEPFWREAQISTLAEYGATATIEDCIQHTMGKRIDVLAQTWVDLHHLDVDGKTLEAQIVNKLTTLIEQDGKALPGVFELLSTLKAKGYRIGLATSSTNALITTVLGKLDIRDFFVKVCSADDEQYGKPHPAVYLKAAHSLGVSPQDCIVIEDSATGMIAAKAASMTTFLVSHEAHLPKFALANENFETLLEVIDLI
jgi:mannitol-1-/sugar-/sorbitol-6-/2-deoxyglucose-6-phosphatase